MEQEIKSTLVSRNITVLGKRTSIRLEPEMWSALKEIADREGCSIHDISTLVGIRKKENTSLTAAIRVFIVLYFRASSTEEGHRRVGHGDFEIMKRRARISDDMHSFFENGRRSYAKIARQQQPQQPMTSRSLMAHEQEKDLTRNVSRAY